ncbi:hypothetical protein H6758_01455 [Candidatus Nomurabacteria bacterium]|nr:hypothetical protein [Candidatus Nomurabacteria bacterium]
MSKQKTLTRRQHHKLVRRVVEGIEAFYKQSVRQGWSIIQIALSAAEQLGVDFWSTATMPYWAHRFSR